MKKLIGIVGCLFLLVGLFATSSCIYKTENKRMMPSPNSVVKAGIRANMPPMRCGENTPTDIFWIGTRSG